MLHCTLARRRLLDLSNRVTNKQHAGWLLQSRHREGGRQREGLCGAFVQARAQLSVDLCIGSSAKPLQRVPKQLAHMLFGNERPGDDMN